MSSIQPDNPSIPIQDVGAPWYRPPRLCARCWSMFEPGSYIDIGDTSPYEHPKACKCERHHEGYDEWRPRHKRLWRVHHESPESLIQAVLGGCEFCAILALGRTQLPNPDAEERLSTLQQDAIATCFSINGQFAAVKTYYYIAIEASKIGGHAHHFLCEFEESTDEFDCRLPLHSLNSTWTGSLECAALAKYWLDECLENHPHCPRIPKEQFYPTRLLKVSATHVYLIDCTTTTPDGPYATLSHCWGNECFDVLTKDTLPLFLAGVPVDNFLPTFREAMVTVRRLGISYIWIDCYCIIQDTMDWDVESSRMLQVYSSSILNIGAEHAENPKRGLFSSRTPFNVKQRRVLWQPVQEQCERLFRLRGDSDIFFQRIRDQGPLWGRAWVVQERLLSPRLLYFEKRQISWTCSTVGECLKESFPIRTSVPDTHHYSARVESRPCALAVDFWKGLSTAQRKIEASRIWEHAVEDYTRARLTYPKDKLPAIKGIADSPAGPTGDVYLNGFFTKQLPKALCWQLLGGKELPERLNHPWRAPTWSWVAWDGAVSSPSLEPVPGQMLAACVSDLHVETGLPCTLYCIGKLLPLQRIGESAYANGFCIGRYSTFVKSDSGRELTGRPFWFPIYVKSLGKPYWKPVNSRDWIDQSMHVAGVLLMHLPDGSFRRVGHCNATLNHPKEKWRVPGKDFLKTYNDTRPELIALV